MINFFEKYKYNLFFNSIKEMHNTNKINNFLFHSPKKIYNKTNFGFNFNIINVHNNYISINNKNILSQ